MSPADRQLLRTIQQRVANLTPSMRRAWLQAIENLRKTLSLSQIADLIENGRYVELFTEQQLNDAIKPLLDQIVGKVATPGDPAVVSTAEKAFLAAAKDIPGAFEGRVPRIAFDVLNPRVQAAVQTIATPAIATLKAQVRQTVRDTVEAGLLEGAHPTAIARGLRDVIGIAPNQAQYVRNLEKQLRAGDLSALDRKLLAKNTAGSLRKLILDGKPIPEARIQAVVAAYEKKWIATNADLNARLLTMDSYRMAKRESYASAIARGIIDGDRAVKTWVHFDEQAHPRPFHAAAQGLTVRFDGVYVLGDGSQYVSAGEGDYNCRCSDRYSMLPLPRQAA